MRVNIRRNFFEEIDIPSETVDEIVQRKLLQIVSPGEYMEEKNGTYKVMKVDHHRHSISTEFVREASDLDKAVFTVLSFIRNKNNQ